MNSWSLTAIKSAVLAVVLYLLLTLMPGLCLTVFARLVVIVITFAVLYFIEHFPYGAVCRLATKRPRSRKGKGKRKGRGRGKGRKNPVVVVLPKNPPKIPRVPPIPQPYYDDDRLGRCM